MPSGIQAGGTGALAERAKKTAPGGAVSNPIRCGRAREGHALSAEGAEATIESYGFAGAVSVLVFSSFVTVCDEARVLF